MTILGQMSSDANTVFDSDETDELWDEQTYQNNTVLMNEVSETLIDQLNDGDEITRVKEDTSEGNTNKYTGMVYEDACEVLRVLNGKKDFVAWTAGDIVVGLTEGIKKKDAVRELIERISLDTNSDRDTITQYRWVAAKFPAGPSRDQYSQVLTWSHFRACAALEDPTEWLDKAAENIWSVSKLVSELATARENTSIQQSGGCSRSGCENNVSTVATERVSLQAYGQKFIFCSAACATNVLLNDLTYLKAEMLGQPLPAASEKSILINHPDVNKRDTMAEEDWFAERAIKEHDHFKEKYARIRTVRSN